MEARNRSIRDGSGSLMQTKLQVDGGPLAVAAFATVHSCSFKIQERDRAMPCFCISFKENRGREAG